LGQAAILGQATGSLAQGVLAFKLQAGQQEPDDCTAEGALLELPLMANATVSESRAKAATPSMILCVLVIGKFS
jgi:hypothetical protein